MPSPRRASRLSIALMLCLSAPLLVPDRAAAERGHAIVPQNLQGLQGLARAGERQTQLNRSPEWLGFQRRHGDWQAMWNERTATPHRAFGRGVALSGFANDETSVDGAVRGFIAGHPELFAGSPDLASVRATHAGRLWYLRFQQTIDGLPVLFADWEFRVSENGKLVGFGADAMRASDYARPRTEIVAAIARESAKQGLDFDVTADRVSGGERRFLLPVASGDGVTLRQVVEVDVRIAKPRGDWVTLVDVENGAVLYRFDRVRAAVDGTVTGLIHPTLPTDTRVTRNFKGEWVNAASTQGTTNASGWYSNAPAGSPVTLTSAMSGPYCLIIRQDGGANASFSMSVSNPSTQNIAWGTSNSLDAERDAFYHVNVAHDYIKTLDPTYAANDVQIPVNINWLDEECSSWWEPVPGSMNFVDVGASCPATATIPDIIYHEYGHAVNDKLYYAGGSTFGMQSTVLHEALADVNAAFITDDPVIGSGFFGPGTSLRTIDNTAKWPQDGNTSAHTTGLILGGALWDLRESVGLAVAGLLAHKAKYGLADDLDPGVAFSEYFIDLLQADDTDGNLSNGTPHFNAIVAAFNAHGIGTNSFLAMSHVALQDQPTNGPYPVNAVVQYTGPVGALAGVTLHYSVNNLPYDTAVMSPTGNPDEWGAEVPAQSGAIVKYYIEAVDSYAGTRVQPGGAPVKDVYTFVAGPAFPLILSEMESNPGWTIGAAGDNASTGIWLRADPVGTQAQPEDDHTVSGTQCYVTGNADPLDFPGVNDVDGGTTTLVTNAFDATGWVDPLVSYWRFFSNDTGDDPGEDHWRVSISNNGGSAWTPIEDIAASENEWKRIVFFIADYVPVTNNMKMRFVIEDILNPSLVEAAVDDWELLAFPPGVAVGGPTPVRTLSLAAPSPNPSRGTTAMRLHLPVAGAVQMSVYDIHGRSIRMLVNGELGAGEHALSWDGRDDHGRAVASGPYFVRVSQAGRSASQAVVMIK